MYKLRFLLPSLNNLVTFEAVSRHNSVADAAEELSITREAVGRQIRSLEEYLGLPLFDREKRGIRLNAIGAQYADQIRPHLEDLALISNKLKTSGEVEVSQEAPQATEKAAPGTSDKPKILVADDEAVNIRILLGLLSDDYYVLAERDPTKIQPRLVREPDIDLLLLDVNMPGMTGLEVCQQIRQSAATSDIPILLITSSSNTSTELSGLAAGANDFVGRPFAQEVLLARVRTLIQYKKTKDRLSAILDERTQRLKSLHDTLQDSMALARVGAGE